MVVSVSGHDQLPRPFLLDLICYVLPIEATARIFSLWISSSFLFYLALLIGHLERSDHALISSWTADQLRLAY